MQKIFPFSFKEISIVGNDLSGANNYDLVCRGSAEQTKHDPPLLYDVNIDPGERFPINNSTELYQ